jgi:hypothetical protein
MADFTEAAAAAYAVTGRAIAAAVGLKTMQWSSELYMLPPLLQRACRVADVLDTLLAP